MRITPKTYINCIRTLRTVDVRRHYMVQHKIKIHSYYYIPTKSSIQNLLPLCNCRETKEEIKIIRYFLLLRIAYCTMIIKTSDVLYILHLFTNVSHFNVFVDRKE